MISVPSFAKINIGLKIGPARLDGFHELRTVYQTLALHDVVRVEVLPGSGIEIRCSDPRVPRDESNTCWRISERALTALGESANPFATLRTPAASLPGKIVIEIEKRLPVQGGLGAASSNAVATMLALERTLDMQLDPSDKLRIAAEIGSDLPLFLIGGTVLGVGRGEEVYPLPDLPVMHVVVVTSPIGISTPRAFAHWDELNAREAGVPSAPAVGAMGWEAALTGTDAAGTISTFSRSLFAGLSSSYLPVSGVPARGGDRAETPLLDLVRAGIENDFERVVFPEYPELREAKELLVCEGAQYASLSGSGSALYGLFTSEAEARVAEQRMVAAGHQAIATTTLTRAEYWKAIQSK